MLNRENQKTNSKSTEKCFALFIVLLEIILFKANRILQSKTDI